MIEDRQGYLARVVDTERRPLRPIGTTAYEVARRTGELLSGLLRAPGVRLYQGVSLTGYPPLPYALSAGPHVVLIEAVAWPPGSYVTSPAGAVHCDDVYIGQSVRPLLGAVRRLRRLQPRGHRVSAVVVVHSSVAGRLELPPATGAEVSWCPAEGALGVIRCRLRADDRRRVPSRAMRVLAAASGHAAG
jgi:hypothetical protein